MQNATIQFSALFIVMVLLQALIFNHIVLYSVGLAFVFIYFIVKLPLNVAPARIIFLAFLIGFTVDIFQDTPGVNALACTILGACRRAIVRLYIPRDEDIVHSTPSIRTLGAAVFAKYVLTMTLLYCLLTFAIEALTFFNPGLLALRVVASTLLTSVLIIAIDSIFLPARRSEKRL